MPNKREANCGSIISRYPCSRTGVLSRSPRASSDYITYLYIHVIIGILSWFKKLPRSVEFHDMDCCVGLELMRNYILMVSVVLMIEKVVTSTSLVIGKTRFRSYNQLTTSKITPVPHNLYLTLLSFAVSVILKSKRSCIHVLETHKHAKPEIFYYFI